MKCQEIGCNQDAIECILPSFENDEEDIKEYYCPEHAFKKGYCSRCGQFCSGIESFDFGPGICKNCLDDIEDYEDKYD